MGKGGRVNSAVAGCLSRRAHADTFDRVGTARVARLCPPYSASPRMSRGCAMPAATPSRITARRNGPIWSRV